MKAIGYSSTWVTSCFINGGCGVRFFAHTNGYGDFVLLDELGWQEGVALPGSPGCAARGKPGTTRAETQGRCGLRPQGRRQWMSSFLSRAPSLQLAGGDVPAGLLAARALARTACGFGLPLVAATETGVDGQRVWNVPLAVLASGARLRSSDSLLCPFIAATKALPLH